MNRKGDLGDRGTDWIYLVLGLVVLIGIVLTVGKSLNAVASTVPNDASTIAIACQGLAGSGIDVLSAPYCLQARETSFGGIGFGIFAKKHVFNCPWAVENNWFTVTNPLNCGSTEDWANNYCANLRDTLGTNYDEELVVNGKQCGQRVGGSATGVGTGTGATTPSNGNALKSCVELGGTLVDTNVQCPDGKSNKIDTGFSDASSGKSCCLVA